MLDIDGVSVTMGEAPILRDVSLRVERGRTLGLLGPSGSGKTTLLRVVAGLVRPVVGSVRIGGEDVTDRPPHERRVGLMFQDFALFPHRTVAGNVEFGLRMRGADRAARRARVAEVLALVGLSGFEDRSVGQLSGGERQRAALARSLAPSPRVLMLDEPLASLDRTRRDDLVTELAHLFEAHDLTVVYVTHDQSEALALSDDVAVLADGRVVQHATPTELWNAPRDPFVARFLGFTNLFAVTVVDGQVRAPFGLLRTLDHRPDGPAVALVRPTAVRLDPAGPVQGVVRSHVFAGDHTRLTVDPASAASAPGAGAPDRELEAIVTGPAPRVGSGVRLAIDPAGVQLFPDGCRGSVPSGPE